MSRPAFNSYEGQIHYANDMLELLDCGALFGRKLTEAERNLFRVAYTAAMSNAMGFASRD